MQIFCSSFYQNFVKYLNLVLRHRYHKVTFGLINCTIFETFDNHVLQRDRNFNKSINKDSTYFLTKYDRIKSSISSFLSTKISYTEEKKEEKGCCDTTDPKDLVLTDKAFEKIKFEIYTYEVVLFMKGNARNPKCGFSKQALEILKSLRIDTIRTVNVLDDQELRNGLKVYSKYPNFPQLYVRGKFVGGLEKMAQMYSDGTLEKLIKE